MASIVGEVPGEAEPSDDSLDAPGPMVALADDIQIIPDQPSVKADPAGSQTAVRGPHPRPGHGARVRGGPLRRQLVAGDVFALTAAWGTLAFAHRASGAVREFGFAAVAVLVTLAIMREGGLYRSRVCALRSLETMQVIMASAIGMAALICCEALVQPVRLVGPVETAAVAVCAVLLLRWRFSRWLRGRRSASEFLRTIIMVGTNEDAEGLWNLLSEEPALGYRVGGVVGQSRPGTPWIGLPSCAKIHGIGELASQSGANGVIVVASALVASERKLAVDQALAAGLHVQVWPGLYGLSSRRARMAPISGVPILYVEPREVARWKFIVKRGMDLVVGALLLVLTAPIVAAAALAVKFTDRGPIIHRSQRVGRFGVTIVVFKLRTMVPDAAKMTVNVAELNERTGGPLFKAAHDPRVTKVGHILRATSIDELPQLWNVLNGTMSLVGPRPALLHEVEHFDAELCRRHDMRPGITGLWQVEARDNPSFSAYRRLDLSYVDDWSLGLDIAILAGTAHQLVVRAVNTLRRRQYAPS